MKRATLFIFVLLPMFGFFPASAGAATLGFGGQSSAVVGQAFNVPVWVSTAAGESANAISSGIAYPVNLLNLVAISKTGSIINLWPSDPSVSSASFEGVILNPGYSGSHGTVVVLTFEAKAPGNAAITFKDPSVLANDGNATPILTSASPDSITINAAASAPATVTPITKPAATSAPAQTPTVPYVVTVSPEPVVPEVAPESPSILSRVSDFMAANGVLLGAGVALLLAFFLLARFIFTYPLIPVRMLYRYRRAPGRTALHMQFDELHDAVQEELLALQQVKTRRQLTDEEERFMTRFEKMLGKVERAAEVAIKS